MLPQRLDELISRFPSRRIAVLGDFFLDKYLDVDPSLAETSVETGKVAHQVVGVRCFPGAAGTVVNNLSALSAGGLSALGGVGNDGEGFDLRRGLEAIGCDTVSLHASATIRTPTYLKPRDCNTPGLEGEHSRYDTKNRSILPPELIARVVASLDGILPKVDAVIAVDQVEEDDCGVVTRTVKEALAVRAEQFPDVIFWADSRRHIHDFRGVIVKPNEFEAVGRAFPQPGETVAEAELETAVRELQLRNRAAVCTTLGSRGMLVSDPAPTRVPAVRLDGPLDTTGAGDSATAGAVLALTAGATLAEAALVGNLVASITVQQLATTGTASPDQLRQRLLLWREQQNS